MQIIILSLLHLQNMQIGVNKEKINIYCCATWKHIIRTFVNSENIPDIHSSFCLYFIAIPGVSSYGVNLAIRATRTSRRSRRLTCISSSVRINPYRAAIPVMLICSRSGSSGSPTFSFYPFIRDTIIDYVFYEMSSNGLVSTEVFNPILFKCGTNLVCCFHWNYYVCGSK